MPRSSDVRLTLISESLRERAEAIMRMYGIKDEKDFYSNALMSVMNMMEKDESLLGVDLCFLVPYILIHENFSFVHSSYIEDKVDLHSDDEITKYLIKKYFNFINPIYLKHLLEYLIPSTYTPLVIRNGNNLVYKISLNNINKKLREYVENFLQNIVAVLNIGKINSSKDNLEIISPYRTLIDFANQNHHLVRVESSVISKRNQIIAKFNLKNDTKSDKFVNDWSLYQILTIYDTLFKNNLLLYNILDRLNDIYTLFLELRKTGHILYPNIKGIEYINYRLLEKEIINKNLDIFALLMSPKIRVIKINSQELIIAGLDDFDQNLSNFIRYTLNEIEIEKGTHGYFKIRTNERIFS
ncbi:conserved hypothetical protein [Sulfolobus islandicus Y.G.57.14]|uniref:Uncharacterized protein n=1 Tax=Saccharolobus islandicus (strain Y.G.57.14 / Yellowstone \|nr:hypothetical protein [Sulfolobus islandicus]ACP47103.1 conserved hypothetical protein [Sulfolobus islandicus Y.G.57.14]